MHIYFCAQNTETFFTTLQCSASCGGGVQHRLIKCVDTKAVTDDEVDAAQCDHELQPASTQKCHVQECEMKPSGESPAHMAQLSLMTFHLV